jgi:hypothetical protein
LIRARFFLCFGLCQEFAFECLTLRSEYFLEALALIRVLGLPELGPAEMVIDHRNFLNVGLLYRLLNNLDFFKYLGNLRCFGCNLSSLNILG